MFKFTDLSDKDEEFKAKDYLLNPKQFFEKRRTNKKNYIFDLRNEKSFEISHLPGAHNLPFEQFEDSIYQMPFSGEIMLYGTHEIETVKAAEILFDNGFDTFSFIDSYDSLIKGVDHSFFNLSKKAYDYISDEINASNSFILLISFSERATALVSESLVFRLSSSLCRSIFSKTFLTASAPIPAEKESSPCSSFANSNSSSSNN